MVTSSASQKRAALLTTTSSTAWSSVGEALMTFRTSAVALCCSSASSRSRRSRADSLSARTVVALRRFSPCALRLRALASLLLALERRRIAHPKGLGLRRFSKWDYSRDLRPAKWGSGIKLHSSNSELPMSALGHKQTFPNVRPMSALPPKADIAEHD